MVIFGAGASYDSAPSYIPRSLYSKGSTVENSRPPLADELFENRPEFADAIARFPACQPVIPYLRNPAAGTSVEQALEQLQVQAEKYPPGLRQLTAIRYYLHFIIWECETRWERIHKGVTNYATLLDQIERRRRPLEHVCLVTFNYDRMLESAFRTVVGIKIGTLADYVDSMDYKIIKLHGSVNWGRPIDETPAKKELEQVFLEDEIPNAVIRLSPVLQISRDYRITYNCPMSKLEGNTVVYPALAIPLEKKLDFECPDYHLAVLRKCILETTKLLVIGWRATDAPFLKLLSENLPQQKLVMVVAGGQKQADEVLERMGNAGIKGKEFRRTESGFTDFILGHKADEFLRP